MLRHSFVSGAIAATAIAISAPAIAQDATALATQVVDLMSPPAQAKAQLDAQMKEVRNGNAIRAQLSQAPRFKQEAAKNQPAFNSAIARIGAMQADALGPIRAEMLAASRQEAIAAYASTFNVGELNDLIAFYKSPTGQKMLASQGQINMQVSKAMATKFAPRVQAAEKAVAPKIEAELKKLFPPQAPPAK
ncbi:DUF2059 domain-containing protein [Sandaracinobacteroides hominis]|uniref:DUF2059 domain-containing protein n=1 Tax=Sandaracinobacteroides hominis TaxID=2780086 RepID=UPI0018F30DC7|nr:DUF2059 domain-containing protein [Sandaracinobacteroides hominis]